MGKELSDDEFEALIDADIFGEAPEQDVEVLRSDPHRWRDGLAERLSQVDREFTAKRAESVCRGFKAKREYEAWKTDAVTRKAYIIERLHEAKALMKELNRQEFGGRHDYSELIHQELIAIRKLLEVREVRKKGRA